MSRRRQKRNQLLWTDQPGLFDLPAESDAGSANLQALGETAFELPERMRFLSFGSGSSGNCSYIGTPECGLLIDAGVNNKYVTEQLAANGIDIHTIQGILLTHDHSDHVRFAYAILRYNRHMRLYATPKAFNGLLRRHSMSRRIADYHTPIYKEFPFTVGPMTVTAFETSHDGSDNCGFCIEGTGAVFVVATDTGTITARTDFYVRKAHYLMIESDYDADMLRTGPYPQHLKARIASTIGHLDNSDTGRYVASVAAAGLLRRVFLCHLSDKNNTPQTAMGTVCHELEAAGIAVCRDAEPAVNETRLHVMALPREKCSQLILLHGEA